MMMMMVVVVVVVVMGADLESAHGGNKVGHDDCTLKEARCAGQHCLEHVSIPARPRRRNPAHSHVFRFEHRQLIPVMHEYERVRGLGSIRNLCLLHGGTDGLRCT